MIFIKNVIRFVRRVILFIIGRRGIYGKIGHHNHFSKGIILYENATIGSYNYISPYVIINNAEMGNYCSIGPGTKIGLAEHDINAMSTLPSMANGNGYQDMQLFDVKSPTVIQHDVWIAANVVIKQGVTIGTGAVIGAGAVVTKSVPPYAIVVGVPGRIIKYRFADYSREILLKSNWFLCSRKIARSKLRELYIKLNVEG